MAQSTSELAHHLTGEELHRCFWSKVARGDLCWNWTAGRTAAGYGLMSVNGWRPYAHRFA